MCKTTLKPKQISFFHKVECGYCSPKTIINESTKIKWNHQLKPEEGQDLLHCLECETAMCGHCRFFFKKDIDSKLVKLAVDFDLYEIPFYRFLDGTEPSGCPACRIPVLELRDKDVLSALDLDDIEPGMPEFMELDSTKEAVVDCKNNNKLKNKPKHKDAPKKAETPTIKHPVTRNYQRNGRNPRQRQRATARKNFRHIVEQRIREARKPEKPDYQLVEGMVVHDLLIPDVFYQGQCHAMGRQSNGEPGLIHGVNFERTTYSELRSFKNKYRNSGPSVHHTTLKIDTCLPNGDLQRVTRSVVIYLYEYVPIPKENNHFPNPNEPISKEHLRRCTKVPSLGEKEDVMLICMKPKTKNGETHLVQALYRDRVSGSRKVTDELLKKSDELLSQLLPRAGKGGLEVMRRNGNGPCTPSTNNKIMKFIGRQGTLPRLRRACVIICVNSAKQCGLLCVYKGRHGQAKTWWYNTPRVGGTQQVLDEHAANLSYLKELSLLRVSTMRIVKHVNTTIFSKMASMPLLVPTAANNLMKEYMTAIDDANESGKSKLHHLVTNAKMTMVCYPCHSHRDNAFDVIEYKVLLMSRNRSNLKHKKPLGRGGLGPGVYVFALVDWADSRRSQTRRNIVVGAGYDYSNRVTRNGILAWLPHQPQNVLNQMNVEAQAENINLLNPQQPYQPIQLEP